jgi:tRNA(fMet)-specific endonuclease VapC
VARLHLLDTNILIQLARGKEIGQRVDARFGLRASPIRPLICCVTLGEVWALAARWNYGPAKRSVIQDMLDNAMIIDINDPLVVKAYVEIYQLLHELSAGSRTNIGENDLWIAAATRATEATLLTTDRHFDPLDPSLIRREWIDPTPQLDETLR